MCIVIDTNCLSPVFNSLNQQHVQFKPVLDWIVEGAGKVVYGGSKYRTELAQQRRYLGVFSELRKAGKIVEVDCKKVDAIQAQVQRILDAAKHNDPHLPAIVCVSKCKLVCTTDARSHVLLKEKRCYPKGTDRPKIYRKKGNVDLLCDANIADVCRPRLVLTVAQRGALDLRV